MSKNTETSELINYFDLGVNGDVGISGNLTLDTIANAVIDTDKFLVSDNGIIKYRTGAELLSDIGAAGSFVTLDTAQTITGAKTFSSTTLQLAGAGSADPTILRNTSGDTGSTTGFNTIGFNNVNNLFVSTQNRGGFILGFNNSVSNRTYTLPDASGTIALTSSIPANPVGGTGTTNYLPKFTGASTIGNSLVFDNGTSVGINTASPEGKLTVVGTSAQPPTSGTTANSLLQLKGSLGNELNIGSNTVAGNYGAYIQASDNNLAVPYQLNLQPTGGNVIIGGYTDSGFKLDVNGTGRFSGSSTLLTLSSGAGTKMVFNTTRNFGVNRNFQIALDEFAESAFTITPSTTLGGSGYTTPIFTLAAAGAATFSSSVNSKNASTSAGLGGVSFIGAGEFMSTGGLSGYFWENRSGGVTSTSNWYGWYTSTGIVNLYNGSANILSINGSTGAATFSSSVTAVAGISAIGQEQAFTWQRTTGTASDIYSLNADSGSAYLYNNTTSKVLMLWTEGGNVGIGTSSPGTYDGALIGTSHKFLNVQSPSSTYAVVTLAGNQSSADNRIGYLTFVNDNNSSSYKYSAWIGSEVEGATANQQGGRLIFSTTGNASSAGPIERMRITSGGNVLIGTTTDNGAKLQVNGNISAGNISAVTNTIGTVDMGLSGGGYATLGYNIQYTSTSNTYQYKVSDTSWMLDFGNSNLFRIRYAGSGTAGNTITYSNLFRINTSGEATFSSLGTGTVYSNGGTLTNTNPSDYNLKTNIENLTYGLDEILKLNPVSFHWKNDTINQGKQFGFIAQEVQKVMPELVKEGDYLGLDKEAIFTTLVNAIKELKQEIDTLKNN